MKNIRHWPAAERPREKLIQKGAVALSDAELLAIFLRTGTAGKNAVELARETLKHFGGLTKLIQAGLEQFCQFPGLGQAKYAQLHASIEMSQRHALANLHERPIIESSLDVVAYLQSCLSHQPQEGIVFILLDAKHRLTKSHIVNQGTVTSALIPFRKLVQLCLQYHAASVIVAHNHPSGDPTPSQQDIDCTKQLKQLLKSLDVYLLDHIIIGQNRYQSLSALGLL